jgi:hypothetical protein
MVTLTARQDKPKLNRPIDRLIQNPTIAGSHADVAELADALDSGSSGRKAVEVQVLSSALRVLSSALSVQGDAVAVPAWYVDPLPMNPQATSLDTCSLTSRRWFGQQT